MRTYSYLFVSHISMNYFISVFFSPRVHVDRKQNSHDLADPFFLYRK
jgi:hypothetical protein